MKPLVEVYTFTGDDAAQTLQKAIFWINTHELEIKRVISVVPFVVPSSFAGNPHIPAGKPTINVTVVYEMEPSIELPNPRIR